jgi:hypothetical protein
MSQASLNAALVKTRGAIEIDATNSVKTIRSIGLVSICSTFLVAISLLGCATTPSPPKTADRATSDILLSRSPLYIAVYAPTSFQAVGTEAAPLSFVGQQGGLLLQLIAAWAEIQAGERFRRDFSLGDPTLRLRDKVAADLSLRLGNAGVRIAAEPLDSERPEDLRMLFGDSLLLSFKTTTWSFHPAYSGAFSVGDRYGIQYVVRGRLTDLAASGTVWEDECNYVEIDAAKYGPTFKDLTANDAAMLKTMFTKASEYCATGFIEALIRNSREREP